MASSYRQLAFQRKLIYLGIVIALFCTSLIWRRGVVEAQADRLALREQSMGEVEVAGVIVRNALIGSRGLVTCAMWMDAIEKKKKNQWNELELVTRALTQLQPHMISPWQFQSWNLTYNVSVESDRIRDKYYWVTRGITLLAEGERQNRFSPELRRDIGSFQEFKICKSDENNVMRSLFQLSCIPPKERNANNFWVRDETGKIKRLPDGSSEVNLEAFTAFAKKHPQLIRRLVAPPLVYDRRKESPKFQCGTVQEIIEFLEENEKLPSLFATKSEDEKLYEEMQPKPNLGDRFPVLPQEITFKDAEQDEWTTTTIFNKPRDHFDAYSAARAWYLYSQELLPPPDDEVPMVTKPVTDPVQQRIPKKMETIIFRMSPPRAQRYVAERLAEEGWFDRTPWQLSLSYQRGQIGKPGKNVEIALGTEEYLFNWSQQAWAKSFEMWDRFGRRNNLLLSEQRLNDLKRDEELYNEIKKKEGKRYVGYMELQKKEKDAELERLRKSSWIMRNYDTGRRMTNFANHYNYSQVESQGAGPGRENEAVLARKAFYEAERIRRNRILRRGALKRFDEGARHWREVLKARPKFRAYDDVSRETVEIEIKYVRQYADLYGRELKEMMALQNYLGQALGGPGSTGWAPVGLATIPAKQPPLVIYGPFAADEKGVPFYSENSRKLVSTELNLSEKDGKIRPGHAETFTPVQ